MTTYPKLKTNLKTASDSVEGVVYYVIKEPNSGKFIRLREPEYFLLNSLDGSRTPSEAAEVFIKTYNRQITPEAIEQFVTRLSQLGFLEGTEAAKETKKKSILFITLSAFNPDKMLDRLYPKTRWLFSTPAIWVQTLIIILGGIVFFANIDRFPFKLTTLFRAADIVSIIVSLFIITTIHEFAHALACKRYGGSVREMGFLLLYFQPCFYCNLSDAYLFPNKRQRLVVMIAGIYFELVLWAGFSLLWRLTVEGNFLNHIFYLTSAVCFATMAFNLNPAIKLDGYYLLADILQIPNLRQKAYGHIWSVIKVRLLGCEQGYSPYSPRERRIFWRYGLLSIAYSIFLIVFVLYRGGELLIGKWSGTGFVLFAALSLLIFRGLITKWARALDEVWRERNKVWMKPKRISVYAGAIVIIALLSLLIRITLTSGGPARLVAAESYVVTKNSTSQLEGRYYKGGLFDQESSHLFQLTGTEYSVTQYQPRFSIGDTIKAGDTLLIIHSSSTEGLLVDAKSELAKAEADKSILKTLPKPEAIAQEKAEIRQAQASLDAANNEFKRVKELHDKKLISEDEFDKATTNRRGATSFLESKKHELKLMTTGPKPEEIARIDAEISRLKARIANLEDQVKASIIISPFAGILVGTSEAKDLFQVAGMESLLVEISLNEADLDILNPGSNVEVRVSAYPSQPQIGKVIKLKLSPGLQAIASITNPQRSFLPGMSGYAKVDCCKISLAGFAARKISRFFRLEFWSWF